MLILAATFTILVLATTLGLVLHQKEENDQIETKKEFVYVETGLGKIQGKVISVIKDDGEKEEVHRFRNIPYAEPPIGESRWKPPQKKTQKFGTGSNNNILEYSDREIWCNQFRKYDTGVEDCLILTIRQPVSANKTHPRPVLFWIHGGGLMSGSSDWYYPNEQCTASLDMVTVSINYRLNLFGFLSIKEIWKEPSNIDDPKDFQNHYYGNFGLMDIVMALEWVQENIASFGGDPKRVTILGESGGGAAVFSLVASPMTASRSLFNKAISASGYPASVESSYKKADETFGPTFKENLNCNEGSKEDILKCLKSKTSKEIVYNIPIAKQSNETESSWDFPRNVRIEDLFSVIRVIDNITLIKPITHKKNYTQNALNLKLLIGNTAQELPVKQQITTEDGLESYLKPRINSFDPSGSAFKELMELYKEKRPLDKTSPDLITPQHVYQSIGADVILSCQTNNIVSHLQKVLKNGKVYRYVLSQPLSKNKDASSVFLPNAYHGIDTDALFGITYYYQDFKVTPEDKALVLNVRKIVKDFVYEDEIGDSTFNDTYFNKTIEFWNSKILVNDKVYHEKECDVLEKYGFLKRSWGQLGN